MSGQTKMDFAKHRTNGFIVDLVRDGLGFNVESISGVVSRDWQEVKKEHEIASKKYTKVMDTVCEAIIKELFSLDKGQESEQDLENIKCFNALVKEFLGYYSQYKSYIETLGASQKQLDFITLSVFFIPFLAKAVSFITTAMKEEYFIIDRILPDSSKNSFTKVCELTNLSKDEVSKSLLSPDELQALKESSKDRYAILESPTKNVTHWNKGENLPKLDNIKCIAKLGKTQQECRKIEILLKSARIAQSLYNKAKDYFKNDLNDLLVEHFRLISTMELMEIQTFNPMQNYDGFEILIEKMGEKLPKSIYSALLRYKKVYFSNPFFGFYLHQFEENKGNYSSELKKAKEVYFEEVRDMVEGTVRINADDFFQHIDFFLPVYCLVPKEPNKFGVKDWQTYFKQRNEAFFTPYKDEVKMFDKKDFEKMINKKFMQYTELTGSLFPLTYPKWEKQSDYESKFEKILQQIQEKYDINEDPYICFMQARFYAQKPNPHEANKYYLKALEYGKNIMGKNYRDVIKEGLMVSSRLTDKDSVGLNNAKSPFTRFYKEGYFLNLISNLPAPNAFSQHFLLDEQKKFESYFCHLYPFSHSHSPTESHLANKKQLKAQKQFQKFQKNEFIKLSPNIFVAGSETIKNIKIDFDNPNKLLTQPNPITQLMHCCSMGDIESVKKLLKAGADVNTLKKSDNASVLHFCIDELNGMTINIPQRIELAKLLIPKCSKILNARLIKKCETVLSRCIKRGLVELVELLIQNGVDLESKTCGIDDLSSLYLCIYQIACAQGKVNYGDAMRNLTEKQIIDIMRTRSNATFDDEYISDFENLKEVMEQNYALDLQMQARITTYYRQNLSNYYQIFDLLLKHFKNNVDIVQEKCHDFTPLIYATKVNETNLVKKLLEKGADKSLKDDEGKTAYYYAQINGNEELMDLLQS